MISSKKNDSQPTLESISFLDGTTLNSGEKLDKIRCKRLRVEGESIFSSDASMLGSLIVNNDIQCKGVIFGELAAEINAAEYTNLRTGWPWPIVGDIYDISLDSLYAKIVALQNTKAPINSPIFTGTVTIPGNINGNCSFSEKIPFAKGIVLYRNTTASNTPLLELLEQSTSSGLIFIPSAVTPHYNPFTNNEDFVVRISQNGGSGANLTIIPWGTTSCGVRVSKESLLLGCGGTSNLPTNRILFNGTLNKMTMTSPNLEISATTVTGITKSMVGLSNVDNTSDANKPVSTATQSALDLKATQTETLAALNLKAPLANPSFTGNVNLGGNLTLNSSTFTNRMVYCGQIALTNLESEGTPTTSTSRTLIHHILTDKTTYFQNLSPAGIFSFLCRNSIDSANIQTLNLSSTSITALLPLGLNSGNSFSQGLGVGIIDQTVGTYNASNFNVQNNLKRTLISEYSSDYNAGGTTPFLRIYDRGGANNRGFNFLPNTSNGAFNSFVLANESLITNQNANVGVISLSTWNNNTANGIKIASSTTTNTGDTVNISLQAHTGSVVLSANKTTPATNFSVNVNNFTANTTNFTVTTTTNFTVTTTNLILNSDVYIKSKSLIIESANNTTYATIATSTGGITLFSNTAVVGGLSADSSLNFAVNQTFNNLGQKTVLVLDPLSVTISRPIKSTDMISGWSGGSLAGTYAYFNTYNGATFTEAIATLAQASLGSVQNRGGITMTSPGTYCFIISYVLRNSDASNDMIFSQLQLGIGTANNTINCPASIYQDQRMIIEKSKIHRRQIIYTRRIETVPFTIFINSVTTYSPGSLMVGYDIEATKIW